MKNMFDSNILVKVGEFSHLKDLVENGTLYMTPLREFRKNSTPGVGDSEEGNLFTCQNMEVWEEDKKLGTADIETHHGIDYPVFCCFNLVVKKINDDFYWGKIPARLLTEFSKRKQTPAFVLFPKKEFISQLQKTELAKNLEYGIIKYSNNFIHPQTYFQKRLAWKHQQEFRVVLKEVHTTPHIIKIGTLPKIFDIINIFPDTISDVFVLLKQNNTNNKTQVIIISKKDWQWKPESDIISNLLETYDELTQKNEINIC